MKRLWLKRLAWILLAPIILFALLMVLLYVPPVQNFIRSQATTMASEATGMSISVQRIDLRFPLNLLVSGVTVINPHELTPDTLLQLQSLNLHIQAFPLFKGRVEVEDISLKQVSLNSTTLISGMRLKGVLGNFIFQSHGIDLRNETALLDRVELSDTHLQLLLADTTDTPKDTTKMALNWRINLRSLKLRNVSVDVKMPQDSLHLTTHIANATLLNALADLRRQQYGWQQLAINGTSLTYNQGNTPALDGLDPAHIALRNLELQLDSVLYHGHHLNAVLSRLSMDERSGLSVTSLTGRLFADSSLIRVPSLRLLTPHSEIDFTAQTYWQLIDIPTTGRLTASFNARIGKQDVLLLAGNLPQSFKDHYPFRPLVIQAGTEGNFKQMQLSRISIDLPGAFSLAGGGEFQNLTDSLKRSGKLNFDMKTGNLNFLADLAQLTPNGSIIVPDSMSLLGHLGIEGSQCTAGLALHEDQGALTLDAGYNLTTQEYNALVDINQMQMHHFMPRDSIYTLSATVKAHGRGVELNARTKANLEASLHELHYGRWHVSGVELRGVLQNSLLSATLNSNNALLQMQTKADMHLDRRYLDGSLTINVDQLDFFKLGYAPKPMKHPFAFKLQGQARRDSINLAFDAGDMNLRFQARSTLKRFISQGQTFVTLLMKQIDNQHLDHAALRRVLPSAWMQMTAGRENPVSYFLATKDISFADFRLRFGFTPTRGINGDTYIHGLRMDSLQLDTIFFDVAQDTTRLKLQGGVVNGPRNPQATFRATLTGEVRNEDAELLANYVDGQGNTGVLFGINARPLIGGHGKGNGVLLNLIPQEPIIAYRKFRFVDKSNWMYLHKNMRVYANIDMDSDQGLCFRVQSDRTDTLALQHLNIELVRLQLDQLSSVLPYLPQLTGLLSVEAKYVQTATTMQLSTEANVQQLTYERQPVGDVGLGATWLPDGSNRHYLNTYLTFNGEQVMTADGTLTNRGGKDSLEVTTTFEHFPLKIANAFIPDRMITFSGDIDGGINILGSLDKPLMNGDLTLDSVSVFARQVGARYWFDNKPLQIQNNRLLFDHFAIYTNSSNPFTIDGNVDFRNLQRPTAQLNLLATNYTLLDAPRTRESMIYGRAYVDLNATLRGPLDGLTMRGYMNLLGNTNLTYVLTDSPLTVEDRLEGLVTFTSFRDTTSTQEDQAPSMSLGGMQMYMSLHIDNSVRLRADLSPDRSKYVELEGGGDLNLQYTPQGDLNLTGRYTLSGGTMKYSLPIIPLKEFQFNSGTYVDWRGNPMDPILNLKATERMRASVANSSGEGSHMVNFDISISIKNRLEAPELIFDIAAPDDASVQNELQAMSAEERSKQAIAMLATGAYLNNGGKGGLTMGAALNSVIQSQIDALAGSIKGANISVGVEDRTAAETGEKQTDLNFRYSQRFFNDRVQIIIGGKVSTGANATNTAESFIDNISVEYRLDNSSTRYIRVFHNKNYESVLDGEITETGVGLVLRRKMDRLSELFIFKRKKPKPVTEEEK